MVADLKPAAVLGLGGFAAAPLVRQARRAGVRCGLLNPDVVPGLANKNLATRVEAIFTQFAGSASRFGRHAQARIRCVGCPVRRHLREADRDEALRAFGLRSDRKVLLVLGGSQGAASINAAVEALAGDLAGVAETWQILHITGSDSPAARRPSGPLASARVPYCRRMDRAYAAADLALSRGGASTIAELAATGTPAVILPYPYHRDQHQRLNAAALVEAGAGMVCDDRKDPGANAAALRESLLPLLRDEARLADLRAAAARLAETDAAGEVAQWLLASADPRRA
jgi:UDP-N-acetylglucosamine--N-acetylmuramyl-(pentapeptide) pyrophosphoryl-undecaprenol N-acetylglucosamine transferase